ncbi:uncharacterized protein haspin [Menidia menidia]
MEPFKPLVLKTYGKHRRKVSAWISPEYRTKAFDSTPSTEESSVFEPAKPKRRRERRPVVGSLREARNAKEKALRCLTEKSSDEENIVPPSAQRSRRTRVKRNSVCRVEAVRPTKKKTKLCLIESSSNEDSVQRPSSPINQRRKTKRKSRLVSAPALTRRKGLKASVTPGSEEESSSPKRQKLSQRIKANSSLRPRSAGRFVTRRRGAASTKVLNAIASILSSSDEFTSGASRPNRIHRPSRRRKGPQAFGLSSAESSVNASATSSLAANAFREISLNESADHILGPCPRKPIFCSTPSAASFNRRGRGQHLLALDEVTSPPSCIGVLSAFPEDVASPQKTASPPQSEERQPRETGSDPSEEPSADLFAEPRRGGCREGAKPHTESEGGESSSINGLSAHSSASARRKLEWMIEALKESCLTWPCTVQLERLELLTLTQICSQTTYSSRLEPPGSARGGNSQKRPRTTNIPVYLQSSEELVSDEADKAGEDPPSVEGSAELASGTGSQGASISELADYKRSDESCEMITDTKSQASCALPPFTEGEDRAETPPPKKCLVQLQKLSPSQQTVWKLRPAGNRGAGQNEESVRASREATKSKRKKIRGGETTDGLLQGKGAALSKLGESLPPTEATLKSSADEWESGPCRKDASSRVGLQKGASAHSKGKAASGKGAGGDPDLPAPKRKRPSPAPRERKGTSATSSDRPATTRKACVSGMSVSRWKSRGADSSHVFSSGAAETGRGKAADCSVAELMGRQPRELLRGTMNFSTPARESRLNLSSLLADFTPSTHTWSRLKAALSIHRKGTVQLTPRGSHPPGSPQRAALAEVSQDLFATPFRTPLSRRLRSQLLSHHSLIVCEETDLSDAQKVYAECGQQHPLPWEECIPQHRMKRCAKIGEGTFGEVFSTTNASGDTVALKVIPLEGDEKVNGEDQKSFGEILHEIIISKELSSLKEKQQNQTHCFIGLNDLHCVQGCYPPDFLKAWDTFDQLKGSENDRPDFFKKDQLFIILEFEFGGVDLENSNGTLASLGVAKSILHQVTAALAVAEQELRFEHRDLHWGNVLVKTTKQKTGSFLLSGTAHSLETKGVLVRIIDYSLSRLEIDDLTVSCDISNDEELFMGQGDYQFDIYRLMRQENGNNWNNYHPHTNVLWLHYLCSKLLSMKYRTQGGRGTKDARQQLARFHDSILQYRSATEALQNCPMFH